MLTIYDFTALSEPEKAEAVRAGSYLADREEDGYTVQPGQFLGRSFLR